ncbi:hypothetical protein, partial [Streptomyces sp. CJ_13]|uniref:hypothetical protein n=1 Tax=Streptomyces sp. CJ_13 TaxID=2724943 RepID=UPI001BDDBD59
MNRACARRLLAVPVLLWAALATTPAVADSRAYATIDTGDEATVARVLAAVADGGGGAFRGGGHHGGSHGNGHGNAHGNGHAHGSGHGHGHPHCPPPP